MTDHNELVRRLRAHGAESWAQCMDEAADAIDSLVRERDDLRKATASPEALHANMLRGGFPKLSIRQALHLHGEAALQTWDSAQAAEARCEKLASTLERIEDYLSSAIGAGTVDIRPPANHTRSEARDSLMVAIHNMAREALKATP